MLHMKYTICHYISLKCVSSSPSNNCPTHLSKKKEINSIGVGTVVVTVYNSENDGLVNIWLYEHTTHINQYLYQHVAVTSF